MGWLFCVILRSNTVGYQECTACEKQEYSMLVYQVCVSSTGCVSYVLIIDQYGVKAWQGSHSASTHSRASIITVIWTSWVWKRNWQLDCLFNYLCSRTSKNTSKSALLALCEGNPVDSPHKEPVMQESFPRHYIIMGRLYVQGCAVIGCVSYMLIIDKYGVKAWQGSHSVPITGPVWQVIASTRQL